jgi:hypothetical protein
MPSAFLGSSLYGQAARHAVRDPLASFRMELKWRGLVTEQKRFRTDWLLVFEAPA